MATLVQYHVNTDGSNGDGSVSTPWNTMDNARAALATLYPSGLVVADVDVEVYFAGATQDTAPTGATGVNWTIVTDATHRLTLLPETGQRATMPLSTSRYRLVQTNGFRPCMTVATANMVIGALQFRNTGARSNNPTCITIPSTAGSETYLYGPYCDMTDTGTAGTACACIFVSTSANSHKVVVRNAVMVGAGVGLRRSGTGAGGLTVADNNLSIGHAVYGFMLSFTQGAATLRNNVASGGGTADFNFTTGGTLTTAGNRSSDATSPDTAGRNQTFTFVNTATGDYHLASGDTGARGQGSNLTADATDPFTTDFDGDTRPSSGAWDSGPDQFLAGSVTDNDPAHTTASVPSPQTVSTARSIVVQAKKSDGTNMTTGGATVVVTITGANASTPTVTDNGNGTYSCSDTPANTGTDSVAITLGGTAISGSPYTSVVQAASTAHAYYYRRRRR